jgi:hypothetical protein
MTGLPPTLDSTTKTAEEATLKAFALARARGRPSVECYRAGVAAWRDLHPEHSPEYAAKRAVAAILSNYTNLRVEA